MSVFQFQCKCGARLVIAGKVRPVCRVCGKQMKLAGKVGGPIMYSQMDEFNASNGKVGKRASS